MSSIQGRKAILLGSGFVAAPVVETLSKAGVQVTVACRSLANARKLSDRFENASAVSLDVNNTAALESAVAEHDIVISLIPYTHHATVIKAAIKAGRHVVTTSYVSQAMLELDAAAKKAGIVVMNEIGLDPGIDHLYAVSMITDVHNEGGKVKGFWSYCGGLPAPECSDNPFGYKFSWSARGVLLALRNPASFYQDGKVINVAGPDLMATAKPYQIYPGFAFEAYPNRDSTVYRERYDIPEAETVIRGTLRFRGFAAFVKVLVDTGFLSDQEQSFLKEPIPWRDAAQKILNAPSSSQEDLSYAISSKTTFKDSEEKDRVITGLKWLGIFSDDKIVPKGNPLDTLCATLEEKMQFEDGERDLVVLQHKFLIEKKDGSKEIRTATLCEYGAPTGSGGYSAMEKLVGVPCAIATKQILDGTISEKGILAPLYSKINDPLRQELKDKYGIECKEKVVL